MCTSLRTRALLVCLLALIVAGPTAVQADGQQPTLRVATLAPLPGDTDSSALGINDRGYVVGNSSRADGDGTISTAVMWGPDRMPVAMNPLPGDTESFGVAINNSGQIVGNSRDSSGVCPLDTAVMWLADGTVTALPPLGGGLQSVANGISDEGVVAGTSKGQRSNPGVDCSSPFTPVFWDRGREPVALPPLDGFPEGYGTTATADGTIVGGSANTTTGFNFQVTTWRRRQGRARMMQGPAGSFLNLVWGASPDGWIVGDSFDFTFAMRAVAWSPDGNASLLPPMHKDTASTGRAINSHGLVAGSSTANGMSTAVLWNRNGKPRRLRPLSTDSQSAAMAINRSGQVAGTSFGNGMSTAVTWVTR